MDAELASEGLTRWRDGDLEGAWACFERGVREGESEEIGLRLRLSLSALALLEGRGEDAFTWAREASERAGRVGRPRQELLGRARMAEARAWLGAVEAEDEARQVLEAREPGAATALAARVLGRVAASRDDVEGALLRFDEAVSLARAGGAAAESVAAHLDAAEVLLDRGGPVDTSAAVGRLAEAREQLERGGHRELSPRLELLLSRARGASGDPDRALAELEALAARLGGARDLAWRVASAQAQMHEAVGAQVSARRAWEAAVEVLEAMAMGCGKAHREAFWHDPARRLARRRASGRREPEPAREPFADGRLARLLEVLKRLASEHDLDRLLERITDCAIELSGAERGFVLLAEEGGLAPRTVRDPARGEDPHIVFSRSIAEAVLIDGEPILTVDAGSDRRLSEYVSVHKLMLRSVACLPIRGRAGTVGVLYLEHRTRRGRFGDADLDLLLAFADQAAIALENASLVANLEGRRVELEEANEELARAKGEIERLLAARTTELEEARTELDRTREALRGRGGERHGIIGRSERMRRVFTVLDRVCDTDVPVVIHGESGTGKELVARAIHFGSERGRGPFVAVNCAAIPEALLESELFGHVKGAFTGADRDRPGLIARASGGTLFLDEVGDMPPKMQVDLLRVLQEQRVSPVGGADEHEVDVRVVSASNKALGRLVERGAFREDLYYRLNVVEIVLPPLRERLDDVPLLCEHFLSTFAARDGQRAKRLSRDAVRRLASHPLPGNVRQLEHVLLNAWVMVDGDLIEAEDLALPDDGTLTAIPPALERALAAKPSSDAGNVGDSTDGKWVAEPPPESLEAFKDQERARILEALEAHAWNRARAAKALGMARRTFYRRLKEYEIL